MTLQEVIEKNRARQNRARELNARAGKAVFVIVTAEMVEQVLADLLPKAKRVADIPFPEDFLLPGLDEAEAVRVEAEYPNTVSVLGRERAVVFRHGQPPQVTVDLVELGDLPAGIQLPDGRAVEASIQVGYQAFANTNIPQLKEQVREHLNREQWERWVTRPAERWAHLDSVPIVKTAEYGKCALTGATLLAYGVPKLTRYGFFGDTMEWRMAWFRTREETEREQEISALRFQAEREKAALEDMVSTHRRFFFGEFSGAEKRARDFLYFSMPADPAGLKNWLATAKVHHAELMDAGRRADADRAKKLEQMRQAEATVPMVTVADLGAKFNRRRG